MIYDYEVATIIENNHLAHEFDKRLCWMRQKGYTVKIDIDNREDYVFIYLKLQGSKKDEVFKEEDIIHIFQHQVAEILAEHIIKEWEEKLVWKKVIKLGRKYLPEERQRIFKKAYDFLSHFNENESLNMLINFNRKNKISNRILDYMKHSNKIIIDGFIHFCMPDYLHEINCAVEIALEEFKNEKEYNEFIRLLQYLVNSQAPKTYEVNIMLHDNGNFYFWDRDGIAIEEKYIDYYSDLCADEISLDDILVSVLITLAPRKIILHNIDKCRKNREAIKIIKQVFAERIEFCSGCKYCRFLREDKDFNL